MNSKPLKASFVAVLLMATACAHTYVERTGLPEDVGHRFMFHVSVEANERGMRTMQGENELAVYAPAGTIRYYPSNGEIIAGYTIPNRSGKNANYYRQKRTELMKLNDVLIAGARKRARSAKDFAY